MPDIKMYGYCLFEKGKKTEHAEIDKRWFICSQDNKRTAATTALTANMKAIDKELRTFEPRSSDDHETVAGTSLQTVTWHQQEDFDPGQI
ncbi:hypothetical protein TNCV_3108191 [Trichonephila clavipes]|uniref:Uncharacterized protein n=1 Tax=Trichonephila clavipes TaxID=2585209 RepID=A0A8X6VHF2_TRICX|nr:hypothetical protein TNCV_3108191 [Trichonephila clavipes]